MKYEIEKWFQEINFRPSEDELKSTLAFFSDDREAVRMQVENLSWDATPEEQQQAIEYLAENLLPQEYIFLIMACKFSLAPYDDQEPFFQVEGGKARWENAAKVIVKIGWPKVDHILVPMFFWLIDSNWPGSIIIWDFFLTLPKIVLEKKVKEIINNPQNYSEIDYIDLKKQINTLCEDAGITL